MRYYFLLQYRIFNRRIRAFGLSPWVAYPLTLVLALGLSHLLFLKTPYAAYLFLLLPLSFLVQFSKTDRNLFLRSIFSKAQYWKIRIWENVLLILPFALYLGYQEEAMLSVASVLGASLLALMKFAWNGNRKLPTPFGRHPFEFTIGFRKTVLVFLFVFFLLFKAVTVGNFNLGMAALVLVFLICFSFYMNTEQLFYVWIFNHNALSFLIYKLKVALWFSTLLSLPVVIIMAWCFPEHWFILILFQLLGYLYLMTILLAKYSVFPGPISLPQGVLIAFSLWFPPLLVCIFPYFFYQAQQKMQRILL